MTGALTGIRVIEFSVVFAAPYAGMHLADLGAQVTKVEALAGDPIRRSSQVVPGAGGKMFTWLNRGKRSLSLNLHDPRAQQLIHRLIADTDVVLINYRPGVAKRLRVDYATLSSIKPDLVYADISGFGNKGPLAGRPGMDTVAQAFAGLTATVGRTDQYGSPSTTQIATADLATGLATVGAVATALFYRERTGEGQLIELNLVRSAMSFTGWLPARDPISDPLVLGPMRADVAAVRAAGGSYAEIIAARNKYEFRVAQGPYYGGFSAKDGAFNIGASTLATRESVRRLFGVIGDRSEDPDYDALDPENARRMDEIYAHVRAVVKQKTVAEWVRLLDEAGVPVAPVNLPEDLADDPHASQMMVDVEHPLLGTQRQVGPTWEMAKTPLAVRAPAPVLGEHNDEVLQYYGYSDAEIEALRAEGVVG